MSFHGSDSALGSSSLYLDGIPFKLGEKFKRPPKVTMPESITHSTVTAALTEEYSFSTEEAVLSWLADVEHAEDVRKQQDLERAQGELENISGRSSEDEDQTEVKEINDLKNWNDQGVPKKNSSWSNPVLANFSSDLLKPTPFMSNTSTVAPNTAGNDFDIRSFDKVDDPFDNLELQVIDDLEELQTILQSSHPANGQNTIPKTVPDQEENVNNSQGPKGSLHKNAVRLKRDKIDSASDVHSLDESSLINDTAEYMNVQSLHVELNRKHEDTRNFPSGGNSKFNGQGQVVALPPLKGTKGTSLLENTGNSHETVRPNSNPELQLLGNSHVSLSADKGQYTNVVVDTSKTNCDPVDIHVGNIYSRHSISEDYMNVEVLNKPVLGKSCDPADSFPKNGLRGAKSTPSLVHCETTTESTLKSPPPRPSSGQSLFEGTDLTQSSESTQLKAKTTKHNGIYENVDIDQSEETSLKQYICDVPPVRPVPKPRNLHVKPELVRPQPVKRESVEQEPIITEPVRAEPVTQELVHQPSVKTDPVTAKPVAQEQVQQPTVKPEPVRAKPVVQEPVQQPAIIVPVRAKPVTQEPVQQPAIIVPVRAKPVTQEPVQQPAIIKTVPVRVKPVAQEPVQQPAIIVPVRAKPVTQEPVQQPAIIKTVPVRAKPVAQEPVQQPMPDKVQSDCVKPEPVQHRQQNEEKAEGRVVGRSTFYENVQIDKTRSEVTWNKYSPLPPPPKTQTKQTAPALPPRDYKQTRGARSSSLSSNPDAFSRAADGEDPYSSLSIEAQAFVNSLTGMGFPRARAARAVLKLGQDHKLVVEHLCLINSMVEKGYAAPLSEMALHLFTNDFNKAVKYLDLFLQFQELGFQNEKIREALVSNDIDRDKALDFLTA